MSSILNRSSALQHFECSNAIKLHNGIMFDFYPHTCTANIFTTKTWAYMKDANNNDSHDLTTPTQIHMIWPHPHKQQTHMAWPHPHKQTHMTVLIPPNCWNSCNPQPTNSANNTVLLVQNLFTKSRRPKKIKDNSKCPESKPPCKIHNLAYM